MRWVIAIIMLCVIGGCRSQSTPLTNPFASADRVPPPATRTLAPGTAQPYYPGDPGMASAPAVVPGGAPATTFAPASTVIPSVTPPPQTQPLQSAPVTPPGGWNQPAANPYGAPPATSYTPAPTGTENSVVRINPDDQSMRFASVPNSNPNDILQVAANQQMGTSTPFVYSPPAIETQGFPNTVQPAQYTATPTPAAASDGFRPQGSSQQATAAATVEPIPAQAPGTPQEDPARFGFDGSYATLRGQLQYYPQTGYWGVRYIPLQGTPDHYGGVAVISNPEILGGLQPGEFLLIQGFMEPHDNGDGTFVPSDTVQGIQRQR